MYGEVLGRGGVGQARGELVPQLLGEVAGGQAHRDRRLGRDRGVQGGPGGPDLVLPGGEGWARSRQEVGGDLWRLCRRQGGRSNRCRQVLKEATPEVEGGSLNT